MKLIQITMVEDDARLAKYLTKSFAEKTGLVLDEVHGSAEAALAKVDWSKIDVLISDLDLPGMGGVDLIGEVKRIAPNVVTLAYTLHDDQDTVFAALRAGASGYLLKGCPILDLEASIRNVLAGESPVSPGIARRLLNFFLHVPAVAEWTPLSMRETKIIRMLAEGLIYKEVADQLGISPHTVHGHVKSIYEKLQAPGRKRAVEKARELGYLK